VLQGTRVHHEHTTLETGSLTWHVQDFTTSELGLVASRGLGRHLALETIGMGVARTMGTGGLSLSLRVPVLTRAVSPQLEYSLLVSIGWSRERR
jgi:hypothetical protein